MIQEIKQQTNGILLTMDIVLNHCSRNSTWLEQHPDSCYNLQNAPWLTAAYTLDRAILQFSHDYANGKISTCVHAPFIENEDDLKQMINALKSEVIDRLFLHEFFHINVSEAVKKLETFMKDPLNIDPNSGFNRAIRNMIRDNIGF